MMKSVLFASTAALAFASGSAFSGAALAADIPVKAPVAAAVPAWTGLYFGGNVGGIWADASAWGAVAADPASVFVANGCAGGVICPAFRPAKSDSGLIEGLQVGYNWRFQNFVFGVEADIQTTSIDVESVNANTLFAPNTPFTGRASERLNWLGTARARLGFVATPNLMIYGTGGAAFGHVKRGYGFSFSGGATDATFGASSDWENGWTAGAGFEWAVAPNVTVGAEYLFVDLGRGNSFPSNSLNNTGCGPAPGHCNLIASGGDLTTQIARLKVNFAFPVGGPLVARY